MMRSDTPSKYRILFTPKFHRELVKDSVEYSWGPAKRCYRRVLLLSKRSVVSFENLVTTSIKTVTILMCWRFAAKVRRYMEFLFL